MATIVNKVEMTLREGVAYSMIHFECQRENEKLATMYLCGSPGIGKSEYMAQAAIEHNFKCIPITVGLIRVERFTGIPDFKRDVIAGTQELNTEWSVPEIVGTLRRATYVDKDDVQRLIGEAHQKDDKASIKSLGAVNYNKEGWALNTDGTLMRQKVLCLLDDWHMAPPEVQAVGFELFTYHSINGYQLDKEWVVFCLAGNASAAAGARNSFSAVMNRVCKLYLKPDFDDWRDKFAYPTGIDPEFVSFLDNSSNRPFFLGEEDSKEPWSSPRSWTECARAITNVRSKGINLESDSGNRLLTCLVAGHVGQKAGGEFMMYHTIYSKINAAKIFDSEKWTLPSDPIKRFAFGAACTAEFFDRHTKNPDNKRVMKIVCEMFNEWEKHCPDIAIRSVRFLAGKDHRIMHTLVKEKALSQKSLARLLSVSKELQ